MPESLEAVRVFFNQRAARWDETAVESSPGRLEAMVRRFGLRPGMTVLDVGTGTGVLLPYLLDRVGGGSRVVAIDVAELMLQRARLKLVHPGLDYVCSDVAALPLPPARFDAVTCYSCFPHFVDKAAALAEIYRVLRPGGVVFIAHSSSRLEINRRHRRIAAVRYDVLPPKAEMARLLGAAGFTAAEVEEGRESYLASARRPVRES